MSEDQRETLKIIFVVASALAGSYLFAAHMTNISELEDENKRLQREIAYQKISHETDMERLKIKDCKKED